MAGTDTDTYMVGMVTRERTAVATASPAHAKVGSRSSSVVERTWPPSPRRRIAQKLAHTVGW